MPYHLQSLPHVYLYFSLSLVLLSCKTQKSFLSFSQCPVKRYIHSMLIKVDKFVATLCFFITARLLFCFFRSLTVKFPVAKFLPEKSYNIQKKSQNTEYEILRILNEHGENFTTDDLNILKALFDRNKLQK